MLPALSAWACLQSSKRIMDIEKQRWTTPEKKRENGGGRRHVHIYILPFLFLKELQERPARASCTEDAQFPASRQPWCVSKVQVSHIGKLKLNKSALKFKQNCHGWTMITGQMSPMTKLLRKRVVLNLAFVSAASKKMGDRCHLVVYSGNDLSTTKKE